ncbi:hypothetical protein ACOSP7_028927 [Xanthoceras sorbifolium]
MPSPLKRRQTSSFVDGWCPSSRMPLMILLGYCYKRGDHASSTIEEACHLHQERRRLMPPPWQGWAFSS